MSEATGSVLAELGIEPAQSLHLSGKQRTRLLNFLRRWGHIADLNASLDVLIPANPTLVSLLDMRVHAFLAEGRPDESLETMRDRLAMRTSFTAKSLLARIYLALGDLETAHRMAVELVEEREESPVALSLLGEIELARENTSAATAAYRRLNQLRPGGRAYLFGMMALHRALGEFVTASAYAVRSLRSADEEAELPVYVLQRLGAYFRESGERTRLVEIDAELARRHERELSELREELKGVRRPSPSSTLRAPTPTEEEKLPTLDHIPVSDAEHARILDTARRLFGFESLLPGQLQTIACVLRGEDVLTILPTGGGKSLCYQLPAILDETGTTLVISPLIALMKDQVDSLPANLGHWATAINSSLEGRDLNHRLTQAQEGVYRLVYAAPERLRQPPFLYALRKAGMNRLVIDEAHCVSMWGHDFRPDYLAIGRAREALGNPPLLAMTATAPSRVRRDIIQNLGNMRIVAGDVTRPNLYFEVLHARTNDDKLRYLLSFCQGEAGSGIVYAGTRDRCERLAALLRQFDVSAAHYHAGIEDRAKVQDDFMSGRVRVAVATIAFGLGIDKPDIRFIVHFVPANSMESYYQEAGRAGRDGLPARCLLMYTTSDRHALTRHAHKDVLSIDFLRDVYKATVQRLGGHTSGSVAMADLERDLQSDRTRLRVALSLLERVGFLWRGPDIPRAAVTCLMASDTTDRSPEFAAFCEAARVKRGQSLPLDLVEVSRTAGIALDKVEGLLLEWSDAGWIDYRPAGRDLLLGTLPPPANGTELITSLLEQYYSINLQRIDEISAYAETSACRHGHINAYLGGRTIEHCNACDNCKHVAPPPDADLPDEREQFLTILRAVSGHSWGAATLAAILRGSSSSAGGGYSLSDAARNAPQFGALAFRSRTAIERLISQLVVNGLLEQHQLEHGGTMLALSRRGRHALIDPSSLDGFIRT